MSEGTRQAAAVVAIHAGILAAWVGLDALVEGQFRERACEVVALAPVAWALGERSSRN